MIYKAIINFQNNNIASFNNFFMKNSSSGQSNYLERFLSRDFIDNVFMNVIQNTKCNFSYTYILNCTSSKSYFNFI